MIHTGLYSLQIVVNPNYRAVLLMQYNQTTRRVINRWPQTPLEIDWREQEIDRRKWKALTVKFIYRIA